MATPLSEMLPQIVTLNVPYQPFNYYAQGNQIIGWWDIAKVTSIYPTQAIHVDESYRLTVTLDNRAGTFDYYETSRSSEWNAGFTDDDGVGLGGTLQWHSGKRIKKSWRFEFGGLNRSSTGGDNPKVGVNPVVYSFETSRIKDPLFGWLQTHGWSHKGFLGSSSPTDMGPCRRPSPGQSPTNVRRCPCSRQSLEGMSCQISSASTRSIRQAPRRRWSQSSAH